MKILKKRSNWINIGLLIFTLIILYGVAELVFRINGKYATFNEQYGLPYRSVFEADHKSWYHIYDPHVIASQTLKEYSYSIMANNEGFLDKDFAIEKKKKSIRIMVIGDSFVQGMGATTDSTCPKQLETILRRAYGDQDIEVWNCGIGNSDPFFEYKLLSDRLLKYSPDYVIEVINSTDINDVTMRGGLERFKADSTVEYRKPPHNEFLYRHSYVVRRVMHDIMGYNWMFMRPDEQLKADEKSIHEIENLLMRFQSLCSSTGIPFLTAFLPRNMESTGKQNYLLKDLIQFCDSVHIKAVDIKPCFQAKGFTGDSSKVLYWPIDGHCNNLGYLQFAECLSTPLLPYLDSIDKKSNH